MLIVHGDNQIASRQAFLEIKGQARQLSRQIVDLPGATVTLSDLVTGAETVSLLGSINSVFVEDFFARRPSTEKKIIANYLLDHPKSEIYVWESKDQSLQTKGFPHQVTQKFDLPKYVFNFLDSFSLAALHLALRTSAPEQILALTAGQVHKLLLVKNNAANLPAWQLAKLSIQAAKYSADKLQVMNRQLLVIDYRQKTSSLPYDLAVALELWVLSL